MTTSRATPSLPVPAWPIPGLVDDVVLASGRGRLWIATSTATLGAEEVWLGAVTGDGVAWPAAVLPGEPCCRPALAGLGDDRDGALAIACVPDGRIAAACHRGGDGVARWQLATDGTPVHAAAAVAIDAAWLAVESRAAASGACSSPRSIQTPARSARFIALAAAPPGVDGRRSRSMAVTSSRRGAKALRARPDVCGSRAGRGGAVPICSAPTLARAWSHRRANAARHPRSRCSAITGSRSHGMPAARAKPATPVMPAWCARSTPP